EGGLGGGRRLRAGLGRRARPDGSAAERMSGVRITHIGGRTTLIEVGGWRLLTDPTFDPAGGKYRFGWGTGSQKLAAPAVAAGELGEVDAGVARHRAPHH